MTGGKLVSAGLSTQLRDTSVRLRVLNSAEETVSVNGLLRFVEANSDQTADQVTWAPFSLAEANPRK